MSNKLTSFVKKHSTAIIVTTYVGVFATAAVFTVLAVIKTRSALMQTFTLEDFPNQAAFDDFTAAMALGKVWDAQVTFKDTPQV